jgi:hypothetical protein
MFRAAHPWPRPPGRSGVRHLWNREEHIADRVLDQLHRLKVIERRCFVTHVDDGIAAKAATAA